ncbi:MAG TPA: rhodanese-like domain-containing protein [Bacteroidia bacterium]|nr:rhodanese-like domain-containing protein [Bacteroidia bacterium]
MKKYTFILIALVFSSLCIKAQTTNSAVISNVSSEEFSKMINTDKTAIIIDLRTDKEIEKGFIAGAIQIDYLGKTFDNQIAALDKEKTYFVYCQSGGRSSDAAAYMEKQGFKKIINLEKGFSDWKQKGFPIDSKTNK